MIWWEVFYENYYVGSARRRKRNTGKENRCEIRNSAYYLILVMKDGDIIEQGNHGELLRRNGFYAQLYNSQFEPVAE